MLSSLTSTFNYGWHHFSGSGFRYMTPRWYYVPDHNFKSLRRVGNFKTNQADWAKQ